MKIAIFGGSFDPPHVGHEAIVYKALDSLDIDILYIVPTYLNPFKKSFFFDEKLRLQLIKKLFCSVPKVTVCEYEVTQKRAVSTIETVKFLQKNNLCSETYLILGEDNLQKLHLWDSFEELNSLVTFVVATRDGNSNLKHNFNYKKLEINIPISSTQIRENGSLSHIPEKIKCDLKQILKKGKITLEKRVENIIKILDEKKAENIEVFDLKKNDYMVDYVVVATTLNAKHALSLLNFLKEGLKPLKEEFIRVDEDDNWTVVDLGDIFIHLMSETYREKYSLEEFLKELPKKEEK